MKCNIRKTEKTITVKCKYRQRVMWAELLLLTSGFCYLILAPISTELFITYVVFTEISMHIFVGTDTTV